MPTGKGQDKEIPKSLFEESHKAAEELRKMFNLSDEPVDTKKMEGMLAEYAGPPCSGCSIAILRGHGPDPDHAECVEAAA